MRRNILILLFLLITSQVYAGTDKESAKPPQQVTHAELLAMKNARGLTQDQVYRISDFRTSHVIPNTTDRNIGATEVLLARAVSSSELSSLVSSESYPEDIIYYELVDSSSQGADRGRIIKRIDPVKHISSFEDWRNVKYRRWNTQANGRGTYTVFTDNGNPSADYYPICRSSNPNEQCSNIDLGRTGNDVPNNLTNIVIGKGARDIVIGPYVEKVTIGDLSNEVYMKGTLTEITIGENCHQIIIGLCSDYTKIGDEAYSITIGNSSSHTEIKAKAFNINIGDFSPSTADNGFKIGNDIVAPAHVTIGPNVKGTGNPVITESNIMLMPQTVYVGNGVADALPVDGSITGTGGSGRDVTGAGVKIAAGAGTGKAAGGALALATAPAGTTGTGLNAYVSWLKLDSRGHLSTAAAGQEPALSNCGKSPSIVPGSTDMTGTFVIGATGAGCTITFKRAYEKVPSCIVMAETPSNLISYKKTASKITVFGRPGTYDFICYGLDDK